MIVAIRHGRVAAEGICYGRWDAPLINPPETDAAAIAARLEGLSAVAAVPSAGRLAGIISSPSARCQQIASRLADQLDLPLFADAGIAELSMGEWEGLSWRQIEDQDARRLQDWMKDWQTAAPPGGETLADLETRVRGAVVAAANRGPAIWLTHAGVIRALRVILCQADWPTAMQSPVQHLDPEVFLTPVAD